MTIALVITVLYVGLAYLVFVRFKWLKFSITWGVICSLTGVHVLLVFVIGLHFMTPYSTDARVIQHTIQLVPRLPEPTLITEVLVKPNTAVKKGQPLFHSIARRMSTRSRSNRRRSPRPDRMYSV